MTPAEFIRDLRKGGPRPAYLFAGNESYRRRISKQELIRHALPEGERTSGLTTHDLDEVSLAEVIDDARSLSLFAPRRVIWVLSAEAALPRGRAAASEHDASALLEPYIKNPSPETVLVFEASRYGLQGEDKKRVERLRKYYEAIPEDGCVYFPAYTADEAAHLAQELAKTAGLRISADALGLLTEAVGYEAAHIATEIEKLQLLAGEGEEVTAEQVAQMVPSARAATIFELVAAMGTGDRRAALGILDTLVQDGEYLPLALTFLATQFRQALVAREMGLRGPRQIEAWLREAGARIWFRKAVEIGETAAAFSPQQLKQALAGTFQADKSLREARPDDRVIMEDYVLSLRRG